MTLECNIEELEQLGFTAMTDGQVWQAYHANEEFAGETVFFAEQELKRRGLLKD